MFKEVAAGKNGGKALKGNSASAELCHYGLRWERATQRAILCHPSPFHQSLLLLQDVHSIERISIL